MRNLSHRRGCRALLFCATLCLAAPASAHAVCEPGAGERVTHRADALVVLTAGTTRTACVVATGERVLLDRGRVERVTIAGTWVGYEVRRRLRLVDAASARRFELTRVEAAGVEELVVGPDGSAAWIRIRERRDDAVLGARHPGGRVSRLDRSGDPLALVGLTLDGHIVRWRKGRSRGRATLTTRDACPIPRGATVETDGGEVVVYRVAGSQSSTVYACLRANGQDRPVGGDIDSSQLVAGSGPFHAVGRSVVFERWESSPRDSDWHQLVVVRMPSNGERVLDEGSPERIRDVRVDRDGLLTWTSAGRPRSLLLR